jgi:hypothetical protein
VAIVAGALLDRGSARFASARIHLWAELGPVVLGFLCQFLADVRIYVASLLPETAVIRWSRS